MNIRPKVMTLIIGLAIASSASAGDEKDNDKRPLGCTDTGYAYHLRVLNLLPGEAGEQQSLYFIYNRSDRPIRLYQMRYEDSAQSMRLNTQIHEHQWGVLSTNEKELKYICSIDDKKSAYGHVVDCEQALQVCEYTKVRFGLNNAGNYWLVDSTTRNSAVHAVVRYGIIPAY